MEQEPWIVDSHEYIVPRLGEQEAWIVDSHEYIVPRLGESPARRRRESTIEAADDVVLLDPRTVEAVLSFTSPAPGAYGRIAWRDLD